MEQQGIVVRVANQNDLHYATVITTEMEESAKARGTGIAKRSPEYISLKITEGKAVIATTEAGEWVGFCYIETWSHGAFVANSGLIVAPSFRKTGVAKRIKQMVFNLSRKLYPTAKVFGLTTGLAVMKINSDLGYEPVTYSELTQDEAFWAGCKSCINYEILVSKERKNCMCTAMLFDPTDHYEPEETQQYFKDNKNIFARLLRFKAFKFLNNKGNKKVEAANLGGAPKSIFRFLFNF
jgi:GNAT superfamily N-acetyltransferase